MNEVSMRFSNASTPHVEKESVCHRRIQFVAATEHKSTVSCAHKAPASTGASYASRSDVGNLVEALHAHPEALESTQHATSRVSPWPGGGGGRHLRDSLIGHHGHVDIFKARASHVSGKLFIAKASIIGLVRFCDEGLDSFTFYLAPQNISQVLCCNVTRMVSVFTMAARKSE